MSGAIGVLTSGGDAPGMNAAVRGVVRAAVKAGREVFLVQDGWQGLVEGRVTKGSWSSVSHTMQRGGTALGTARSDAFRTSQGRAQAAQVRAGGCVRALCRHSRERAAHRSWHSAASRRWQSWVGTAR